MNHPRNEKAIARNNRLLTDLAWLAAGYVLVEFMWQLLS